jgi:hypothetical protein
LKFSLVDLTSGYTALRNALSRFLQLAAISPSLLIEEPNGSLVISLSRTLCTPRYELTRFVLYDVISAFLFGMPSLAEYGYDGECGPENHGFEWVHGIPVTLFQVISQVNSWRNGAQVRLSDWQTLERRVLDWKSRYPLLNKIPGAGGASTERAIVQEGWRHVLLIYIYMVSSLISYRFYLYQFGGHCCC